MYIERKAYSKKITDLIADSDSGSNYKKGYIQGLATANGILLDKNQTPTADVAEVKHGEWVGIADFGNGNCIGYCSACGTTQKAEHPTALKMFHIYCRWCGAKMDGAALKRGDPDA